MKKRKYIKSACILFVLIAVFVGCWAFIKWDDERMYPKIPEESMPDKVVLTSDGCCFVARSISILLQDENSNKTVLISDEEILQYETLECNSVPDISTPIKVIVEFIGDNKREGDKVSMVIWEFPSTKELKESGLLLTFRDAELLVCNGTAEKLFRPGFYSGSSWSQLLVE